MAAGFTSTVTASGVRLNVADRLTYFSQKMPDAVAVASVKRPTSNQHGTRRGMSGAKYATITFAELDAEATRLARGLINWGFPPGGSCALLVRPGIEFVTLVFALLRAGAVIVLIDPGLGRMNLIRRTGRSRAGRIRRGAGGPVHSPPAPAQVSAGEVECYCGAALGLGRIDATANSGTRRRCWRFELPETHADDPAAIIFTSGSTGPAKGVLYSQRMFDTQISEIQSTYAIEPGGVDLSCFPLFGLFNSAMGVTTVLPDIDFSHPASASPLKLLDAAEDWQVTQAFASPAVWKRLSRYCAASRVNESVALGQIFSCSPSCPRRRNRDNA